MNNANREKQRSCDKESPRRITKTIKDVVEPRSHADQSDNPRHLNSLLELFN
jgi:hypothetical protein